MDATELVKKVRLIAIRSRRLSNNAFAGQYHSAFKGKGMTFSEVREYLYGDDVRSIDWNVTARFNHPYVKLFEEERELTTMLLIDVSASNLFGTHGRSKQELISELAGLLSFSAMKNNDKVGVIFFSDRIEKFIPPKKGQSHAMLIIRELLSYQPTGSQTNMATALAYMSKVVRKRSIAFLISDFLDQGYEDEFRLAARKHDLVAIRISDPSESSLPLTGLVYATDPESGNDMLINTSSPEFRAAHAQWWRNSRMTLNSLAMKTSVDVVDISCVGDYIPPLVKLFKKREKR